MFQRQTYNDKNKIRLVLKLSPFPKRFPPYSWSAWKCTCISNFLPKCLLAMFKNQQNNLQRLSGKSGPHFCYLFLQDYFYLFLRITRHKTNVYISSSTERLTGYGYVMNHYRCVQIVVSKLPTTAKPTKHPEILEQYDKNTIDCVPYIAAEIGKPYVNQIRGLFTVGDNQLYSEFNSSRREKRIFRNANLERDTYYSVFQRTFKSAVREKYNCLKEFLVQETVLRMKS